MTLVFSLPRTSWAPSWASLTFYQMIWHSRRCDQRQCQWNEEKQKCFCTDCCLWNEHFHFLLRNKESEARSDKGGWEFLPCLKLFTSRHPNGIIRWDESRQKKWDKDEKAVFVWFIFVLLWQIVSENKIMTAFNHRHNEFLTTRKRFAPKRRTQKSACCWQNNRAG